MDSRTWSIMAGLLGAWFILVLGWD